ncbi:hypothetical protein ACQY0O_000271 [Thecaphora frezii]
MRYASLSAAILASLVTTGTSVLATPIYQELALRQNADANGLLESLRNNNLTRLADVLANHTAVTDAIFADDSAKYFLAPNNEAVAGLPEWVTSNSSRLEATLLQHVLRGNFNPDDFNTFPLHTLGHSLLTSKDFARLPGGAGQALALSKVSNGSIVAEAVNNDTFVGAPANFNRITIQPISHAVTVPGTVIETLQYLQYGLLLQTLSGVNNGSLIKHLDEISGITVFAPTNKAITAFLASKPNTTELPAVLGQHVVMNRVLYSPLLIDQGAIISASGQDVKFDNEQGTLTVDGKSARILQADIICSNGVIHSIDAVIASGALNATRAEEAAASAQASIDEDKSKTIAGPISGKNAITSQGPKVPPAQDGSDANKSPDQNGNSAGTGQTTTGIGLRGAPVNGENTGPNASNFTLPGSNGGNGGNGSNGGVNANATGQKDAGSQLTVSAMGLSVAALVAVLITL